MSGWDACLDRGNPWEADDEDAEDAEELRRDLEYDADLQGELDRLEREPS